MAVNTRDLKRHRLDNIIGQETLNQVEHITNAGAKLVMSGVLVAGTVITADPSSAPVKVWSGSILRIECAAATYVAFGDDDAAAPMSASISVTTSPGLKLLAGVSLVVATGDFVKMSVNPTRFEVINNQPAALVP